MNWSIIGWGVIGFAAVSLAALSILFKHKGTYPIRKFPQFDSLDSSRIDAIEGGLKRTFALGHQLFSAGYPGLGLSSLSGVPGFLDPEILTDGKLDIAASEGALAVFAQQIIENRYQNGFSQALIPQPVKASLPGPTPFAFTAGLLSDMSVYPQQGLVLTGNFGPEASLWSEICLSRNGDVFASAGTITSQAALYPNVKDLMIGETAFSLPGLINPNPGKQAGWLVEDVLRVLLIFSLIAGIILKLVGVL